MNGLKISLMTSSTKKVWKLFTILCQTGQIKEKCSASNEILLFLRNYEGNP